jgi:ketosteroid isomerase-like protein
VALLSKVELTKSVNTADEGNLLSESEAKFERESLPLMEVKALCYMRTLSRRKSVSAKTVLFSLFFGIAFFSLSAKADDASDVRAAIERWNNLESDLGAQAAMIRKDRVQIVGAVRKRNQDTNLASQQFNHDADLAAYGDATRRLILIEDPEIRIYGATAVASFTQIYFTANAGQPANPPMRAWSTLVLVKNEGQWKIAHHHWSRQ